MSAGPGSTEGDLLGGQSDRTAVRRNPGGARYDRATVYEILDRARFCHVGFVLDGSPVVLPTIHDRVDDVLYLHGSRSNRMLRAMTGPAGACVTVTLFDGLVLARSVFNHTMNYRSVAAFGHPAVVGGRAEKVE
ncbi:MAG TPA: pyridoxamine 5'-phosphate oxidase family protein, partial [Acidimicrobiales bacterium]|nr:pyridoxamine 5'-phosphate oxidase family protein [Acidimicrobiales bacterium]